MSAIPWTEKVPMLSINPDTATWRDIARMAAELMVARQALTKIANKDYRGNRSSESVTAFHALKEMNHE